MIKLYLKQAWTLIKQNGLFTFIYVVGTGLSIALAMTMFIIFYVKFAPIYPEYNRERTLVIKALKRYPKGQPDNWNINGGVSYYVVKEMLKGLPHLEAVGGGCPAYGGGNTVVLPGKKETLEVDAYFADCGFWKVFTFHFLHGKPYTQEDMNATMPIAVLSARLAKRIFASTEVSGKFFTYNGKEFRVCGVVEDVSNATPETAADLWFPISHGMNISGESNRLTGNVHAYLLAYTSAEKEELRKEVQELFRKHNLQDDKYDHDLMEQPDDYWKSTFRQDIAKAPDMEEIAKSFLYILLALLFIPAMNLSGMISSRMNHRLCELGVRKAYGASNRLLLGQVLWENLLLTCIGGLAGLGISYLIVLTSSDWILTLFDEQVSDPEKTPFLTSEMLFNPMVFCTAFGLCIVLNLVSALLPAVFALRHTIVRSLNSKR